MRAYQKPNREPCSIKGCGQPLYCRTWCTMHYTRWLKRRELGEPGRLRGLPGSGSVDGYGYRVINDPTHPLARQQGKVKEHRAVLYDRIGPGPHPCYWCGESLDWDLINGHGGLNVDHLDDNKLNNDPANLVPACLNCNTKRGAA